jgi:hypothetical protein
MMMAAMHGVARGDVPSVETILPGRRFEDAQTPEERGAAPPSLLDLMEIVGAGSISVADASRALIERGKARERVVSEREAQAAVMVAIALEWLRPR